MIKGLFSIVLLSLTISLSAQTGGDNIYNFLNITNSARIASLGGQQVSIKDNDLNLVFHNPSLLTSEMNNHLVLNYLNYFSGANIGYVAYAWKPEKKNTLAVGLHYLNYGEFVGANSSGIKTGSFRASEYALNIFWSRPLIEKKLDVGVTLKPIYSQYANYTSLGLAFDAGLTYISNSELFTSGLVFKNIGSQITKYNPSDRREPLPFEIQLGITQRLRHAPFRFSIIGHHLQKPDLLYETEEDKADNNNSFAGQEEEEKNGAARFADNFMRHINFGVEFIPTNNFYISLGYNYKQRKEKSIEEKGGMVGFSYGFGIKIKKFRISYGRATYHLSGASNHFSVTMNLSEFGHHL